MDDENRLHGEMLMARWADFRDATYSVLEAAGYRPSERVPALTAFAVALVAETVSGTPDPGAPGFFSYSVLGPGGERILVWVSDAATQGLEGGLVTRFDEEKWDRIAFVIFQNLEPQAIHLMDAACFRRVRMHLATAAVGPVRFMAGEDAMCLSAMLHMNIAMEPLVAEVLGIETTWLARGGAQRRLQHDSGSHGVQEEGTMSQEGTRVAGYIQMLQARGEFERKEFELPYHHMAATITDGILQAGLKYQTVVSPKIGIIRTVYRELVSTSAFVQLLDSGDEFWDTIKWHGELKRARIETMARHLKKRGVEDEARLLDYLETHGAEFRQLPGVGPKTFDYFMHLAGADNHVAIDRQLVDFLEVAGVAGAYNLPYADAQSIVMDAAAELGWPAAALDHSIWRYMTDRDSDGEC